MRNPRTAIAAPHAPSQSKSAATTIRERRAIASASNATAAGSPGSACGGSRPDRRVAASAGLKTPRAAYTRRNTGCTSSGQPLDSPAGTRRTISNGHEREATMAEACASRRAVTSGALRPCASGDTHTDALCGVTHADDVIAALAARRIELEGIAFDLADQRARDRRGNRNASLLDVGFQVADDLVDDRLPAILVFQSHRRAEHHFRAGIQARDVD